MAKRYLSFLDWKSAVLLAFAIWLFVVGSHHEPWFDESQAWLLARDSSLYQLLVERVRYEGTPGLWHLLLWIAIRCGLPFSSFYLIPVACALAGAAIVLWRSPFPAPLRVLIVASYFFAYQFSIVARSYALDLVLVPALASLFAQRTTRPLAYGALLGLLANSNAHSFFFASVLGAEWLWALVRAQRVKTAWTGLASAIGLGLFALFVAWQPADNAFSNPGINALPRALACLIFINEAFIDRLAFWSASEPTMPEKIYCAVASIILLLPSLSLFLRAKVGPLAIMIMGTLIGFSLLVYAMEWHSGVLFLAWIFSLWIAWPALQAWPGLRRAVVATLAIVSVVQATEAARTGLWDIGHVYTGSASAAKRITALLSEHPQARVAAAGFMAIEVLPYFPYNIFANFHEGAPQSTFIQWKHSEWPIFETVPEAYSALESKYDLLLLSPVHADPDELAKFESVAATQGYRAVATYPANRNWKGYTGAKDGESLIIFGGPVFQAPAR